MRPTFLVLGAAKAGTTSLCHLIGQHPDVYFTPPKELHYFSFDEAFARGDSWYERWFEGANGEAQIGEGSTTYSIRKLFPRAAERIHAYDPGLKLIYIARAPLTRIESGWLQLRHFGPELPFAHVELSAMPEGLVVAEDFDAALHAQADALIESTNYWRELEVYRALFPDDQLLVLQFEAMRADPAAALRRVFTFLDVDPDFTPPDLDVRLNPSEVRRLPRGFLWRFWSDPKRRRAYTAFASRFPRTFRDAFRGLLTRPGADRPSWNPTTRAAVLDHLRDDSRRFLEHYGYPPESWHRT